LVAATDAVAPIGLAAYIFASLPVIVDEWLRPPGGRSAEEIH